MSATQLSALATVPAPSTAHTPAVQGGASGGASPAVRGEGVGFSCWRWFPRL